MSVLRWADNPRNSLAAFRVLQLLPGMGPANARKPVSSISTANNFAFASLKTFAAPAAGQVRV